MSNPERGTNLRGRKLPPTGFLAIGLLTVLGAAALSIPSAASQLEIPAAARGFSGGGGMSQAAGGGTLKHFGSFDGPGGRVQTADSNVVVRNGSLGRVYSTSQFFVAAASNVITEAGGASLEGTRTQLGGVAFYDDATSAVLPGSRVGWLPPEAGSALAGISSTGLAQAGTVPETTSATYAGRHGGLLSSGTLWVVNALPDNHGVWAGDGFDDQWQKANNIPGPLDPDDTALGMPYWMHYAFSSNPLNPNGRPPATLESDGNDGFVLRYTRNPLATGMTFTPESSEGNLDKFLPVPEYIEISTPDGPDREHVEIQFPHNPGQTPSRFFRIRVQRGP